MRRRLFHISCCIFLLLQFQAVTGQSRYAFTRFSSDDGLSSNAVYSIYQDKSGFIWVGSSNGLQRYDGSKFISFSNNPKGDELPATLISQIVGNPDGTLWLVMNVAKEVGLFNPSTFHYRKIPVRIHNKDIPPSEPYELFRDKKGRVFLLVMHQLLLVYDEKTESFTDENVPLKIPAGWRPNRIFEDPETNRYWIAADSGLAVYDDLKKEVYHKKNNPEHLPLFDNKTVNQFVTNFFIDRQRRYWIFNWISRRYQMAYSYDEATGQFTKDSAGLNVSRDTYYELANIFQTKKNMVWVYGLEMMLNYDEQAKRFLNNKNEFIDNYGIRYRQVNMMMEDREGSVWVATDQGLYFFSPQYQHAMNIFFKKPVSINAFLHTNEKQLWIGCWGDAGIRFMDESYRPLDKPLFTIDNKDGAYRLVWSLRQHSKTGHIWIGCQAGRLMVYQPETKKLNYYQPPEFKAKTITGITEDTAGDLWFGTWDGRLLKYSNGKYKVVQDFKTQIYTLTIDKAGWLWIGTNQKGVFAVDSKTGSIVQEYKKYGGPGKSLFNNFGGASAVYNDSIIFIAAEALNIINKKAGTVKIVSLKEGLPSNSIRSMTLDHNGGLWLATSNGLSRYNYSNSNFTHYTKKDGIMSIDNAGEIAYCDRNNNIVFGGTSALLVIDPAKLKSTSIPNDVTITDFKLLGTYLPVDSLQRLKRVKLNHDENAFVISFASLSYMQRDKLVYYYKMEGIDTGWTRAGRLLQVNYTRLPPGSYSFLVRCETNEGLKSNNITQLQLQIGSPFWKTWWFLLFAGVLLASLVYFIHRLRVNKLLAVEKLRLRVARDLHDDMGSTLSTINILSTMAKAKIATDPVRTSEYISKITDNSSRMMEAMDDIVWSIKPSNDTMQRITARMREFATNVLEAKEIDLRFSVDEAVNDVKLDMEARRDLFLLFKEAVNNIAKYSKCSKATIDITSRQKRLILVVKDDGVGFYEDEADNGNGLGNMRKRADALKGRLQIQSDPGHGTRITLNIPIT